MIKVRYADLAHTGILSSLIGVRVGVLPVDHPNQLFNFNWILVGPVICVSPGSAGPCFTANGYDWAPADEDEPAPWTADLPFKPKLLQSITVEVSK